jgi:hypothetical protein
MPLLQVGEWRHAWVWLFAVTWRGVDSDSKWHSNEKQVSNMAISIPPRFL